jgi:uncharacterized protein YjiS (DUF1127 family)
VSRAPTAVAFARAPRPFAMRLIVGSQRARNVSLCVEAVTHETSIVEHDRGCMLTIGSIRLDPWVESRATTETNWPSGEIVQLRLPDKLRCNPGLQEIRCAGAARRIRLDLKATIKSTASVAPGLVFDEGWIMTTYETRYFSAAALFGIAALMQAAARRVRAAAKWMDGWLERRQLAAAAFNDFERMSERELLDIGLSRAEVNRAAWGASDRNHNSI